MELHIKFHSNGIKPFNKLSNFANIEGGIELDGLIYPSSEHMYQSQKFVDKKRFSVEGDLGIWSGFGLVSDKTMDYWKKKDNIGIIAKMATSKKMILKLGLIKIDGFQYTDELWNTILTKKYEVKEFEEILKKTEGLYLLEFDRNAVKRGSFWGGNSVDNVLYGENTMGKYLMKVRDNL
tara:strand:+ start:622 stop:1158 length:537 start_codon:yes stop_codon:yes gene_type:complete